MNSKISAFAKYDFGSYINLIIWIAFRTTNGSPCNSSTNINNLGPILCHYSSLNGAGYTGGANWADLSGNGNDLSVANGSMFGLTGYYGSSEDYVKSNSNGYIKFPNACNLPSNGYTLFTASMYYGPVKSGNRAFGSCDDDKFVSGWHATTDEPWDNRTVSSIHNNQQISGGDRLTMFHVQEPIVTGKKQFFFKNC
eukprot:65625_1